MLVDPLHAFCDMHMTAAKCTGEETPEAGPTILVDFKIVMFSASGLKVVLCV